MRKIKVGIEGNGTVRIKLKKKTNVTSADISGTGKPSISDKVFEGFSLPFSIINQMEIRVESVFRPKQQDVEVVYALSGQNWIVDQLHKLASNEVVAHATPEMVSYYAGMMAEQIYQERSNEPRLIIHVHSHPYAPPMLSDIDRDSMAGNARRMKDRFPEATVIFGIHSVSSEQRRQRIPPKKSFKNLISWSSITRVHEVAFFDEFEKPVEVRLGE